MGRCLVAPFAPPGSFPESEAREPSGEAVVSLHVVGTRAQIYLPRHVPQKHAPMGEPQRQTRAGPCRAQNLNRKKSPSRRT